MNSAGWDSQNSPCAAKGPSPAPLPAFGGFKGGVTIRKIPPWPLLLWPQPCERSQQESSPSLPKSFALCLVSGAHTALCKGNHLDFFFFNKDFPISFKSSPAPIELREMGLLICRHELIAHELWQLFQEGVCKVISAINPLWVGWEFFLPFSFSS